MYYYSNYNTYADNLHDLCGTEIIRNTGTICGNGIFEGKTLKKEISFTPYIYNSCSADCLFCSEKLERSLTSHNRSEDIRTYRDKLSLILKDLYNNKIFLSLSGKEPSESPDFLENILSAFKIEENNGLNVVQKVMYSNLSGFVEYYDHLGKIITDYGLTRIETSRHHFDDGINQNIMNFRGRHKSVMSNAVYSDIIKSLKSVVPIRLVCVLQKSGISRTDDIYRYISWAEKMGINEIIFRELSVFDNCVKSDSTENYIRHNRVEILDFLEVFNKSFELKSIYKGYYYFSFRYKYGESTVIFEMSDYEEMIKKHKSNEINKLIYYPNKDLCLDWNMQNKIF